MADSAEQHADKSVYQSVFTSRYCKDSAMLGLFSEAHRAKTMRQLWCYLARGQYELGVHGVTEEKVLAMESVVDSPVDWHYQQCEEARTRHDVMSHIAAFERACPIAAGIIHLGATSCFVQDNADLVIMRRAMRHVAAQTAHCLHALMSLCARHGDTACCGRTHYQAASVTTVAKRAALWANGLLLCLKRIEAVEGDMRLRGAKGATGSQDSYLALFGGDEHKVLLLDTRVAQLAGFDGKVLPLTGQTYDRLHDCEVVQCLSLLGASAHKICMDVRMLQALGEVMEPFAAEQVGSSAMPYKRNPMRCERACGLARHLLAAPVDALNTAACNGFERTLDDSSNRRIILPESFLTADALLSTLANVLRGLHINEANIGRNLAHELPFVALERVLMQLVKCGRSRQEAHAKIRTVSLAAAEQRENGHTVDLVHMLQADDYFAEVLPMARTLCDQPIQLSGMCRTQVTSFIEDELKPALHKYDLAADADGKCKDLDV